MKPIPFFRPALFLFLSAGVGAQPPKAVLLNPQYYVENPRRPVFKLMEDWTVRNDLKIVSGRSSAALEFNTPKVVVYLPEADNSAYAWWSSAIRVLITIPLPTGSDTFPRNRLR